MTIQAARKTLSELQSERNQFSLELATLQAKLTDLEGYLPSAYAVSERGGNGANPEQIEGEISDLKRQIERKTAAISAINSDIDQAEKSLHTAQKTAVFDKLRAMLGRVRELSQSIDTDPLNAAVWVELRKTINDANNFYRQQQPNHKNHRQLLPDPLTAVSHVLDQQKAQIQQAMGKQFSKVAKRRTADILGLDAAEKTITNQSEPVPIYETINSGFLDWIDAR